MQHALFNCRKSGLEQYRKKINDELLGPQEKATIARTGRVFIECLKTKEHWGIFIGHLDKAVFAKIQEIWGDNILDKGQLMQMMRRVAELGYAMTQLWQKDRKVTRIFKPNMKAGVLGLRKITDCFNTSDQTLGAVLMKTTSSSGDCGAEKKRRFKYGSDMWHVSDLNTGTRKRSNTKVLDTNRGNVKKHLCHESGQEQDEMHNSGLEIPLRDGARLSGLLLITQFYHTLKVRQVMSDNLVANKLVLGKTVENGVDTLVASDNVNSARDAQNADSNIHELAEVLRHESIKKRSRTDENESNCEMYGDDLLCNRSKKSSVVGSTGYSCVGRICRVAGDGNCFFYVVAGFLEEQGLNYTAAQNQNASGGVSVTMGSLYRYY
jgi:hypothetical protein